MERQSSQGRQEKHPMDKALARLVDAVQAICIIAASYLIYQNQEQTELMAIFLIAFALGLALAFEGKKRTQVIEGELYMIFLGSLHMWTYTNQNFFWGILLICGIFLVGINLATIFVVMGRAVGKEY